MLTDLPLIDAQFIQLTINRSAIRRYYGKNKKTGK